MGAEEAARVLHGEVALDERLEQVADRARDCDAEAYHERVGAVEPLVLVGDGEQPERERAADHAGEQPLDGLVRRDPRRERAAPPRAAAEVRGGVPDEGSDQHVEDEPPAVVEPPQQHRVRHRQPDPHDPEEGDRHRP